MSKWIESNATKLPVTEYIQISTIRQIFPIALMIATLLLFVMSILAIHKKWFHIFVYGVIGFFIVISAIWILTILIYKTL